LTFAQNPENTVIKSGVPWYDTSGNEVHAHGGGFYVDNTNKYYFIGTTRKLQGGWLSEGINCYSSDDLGTWKFENEIFHNSSIQYRGYSGIWRIERPKVLYNDVTRKFVMWFHLDTASFQFSSVGVAVSDTVCGNYQWVGGFKPDGEGSYDMTLFKDDDGSAYLCRSVNNQYAGISQLTPDYLNTTGIISKGPQIEGQAIWKINGKYYLLGSHLTGWSPNKAVLATTNSKTLKGATWDTLPSPTDSPTTWNSQSTFVLPYSHPDGRKLYIFMADRWDFPNVGDATYVWLPFNVSSKGISILYFDQWKIKDY